MGWMTSVYLVLCVGNTNSEVRQQKLERDESEKGFDSTLFLYHIGWKGYIVPSAHHSLI